MKMTGHTNNKDFFKFYESDSINFEKIYEVSTGKLAGCIFRKVISEETCKAIANNFWHGKELASRSDGVPGFYLGTYHYKKDLAHYLSESIIANKALDNLFSGTDNIFEDIMNKFSHFLKDKPNKPIIRPAQHNGIEACKFFMRAWKGNGEYSLEPHDDSAQCTAANQKGFEIQEVIKNTVVAINMCIENEGNGKLHYWDIQPDQETKLALGLEEEGYPYSLELLKDFKRIELEINAGDIYFFNGNNVHAVSSPQGKDSYRTTIAGLMGFKDEKNIIYWT